MQLWREVALPSRAALPGSRPQDGEKTRRPVTPTCGLVCAQTGDGWRELPTWQEQLTLRMFMLSFVVGVPFTVIILKLSLTAGIIPGMAIPIAMIGWVTLMWWVRVAQRCGFRGTRPFTVMVRPCLSAPVAAATPLCRAGRGAPGTSPAAQLVCCAAGRWPTLALHSLPCRMLCQWHGRVRQ